jgi:hypothetical protein
MSVGSGHRGAPLRIRSLPWMLAPSVSRGHRFWVLTAMLVCASVTAADRTFPFYEVAPKRSDPPWIRYWILAPQNHPLPVIYVSHEKFKPQAIGEFFLILPRLKYNVVARSTHEQMVSSDCLLTPPDNAPSVQILEHEAAADEARQCILRPELACEYLSKIVTLPGVDWAPDDVTTIRNFMGEAECPAAVGTKSDR